MSKLFLHSLLGSCELGDVVVECGVVAKGEVVRGKIGFHQWRIGYRHFHDVQDAEPISVLVLGYPEELLDGAIHSLGLSVGLGVEGA